MRGLMLPEGQHKYDCITDYNGSKVLLYEQGQGYKQIVNAGELTSYVKAKALFDGQTKGIPYEQYGFYGIDTVNPMGSASYVRADKITTDSFGELYQLGKLASIAGRKYFETKKSVPYMYYGFEGKQDRDRILGRLVVTILYDLYKVANAGYDIKLIYRHVVLDLYGRVISMDKLQDEDIIWYRSTVEEIDELTWKAKRREMVLSQM